MAVASSLSVARNDVSTAAQTTLEMAGFGGHSLCATGEWTLPI